MGGLLGKLKNMVAVTTTVVKLIPKVTVSDLDLKGLTFEHVEYLAKLTIDNPYPVSIPVTEIAYHFKSDGRVIVHVAIPDPGSLKAHGKTDLDVIVKVPHNALRSLVTDVSKDWDIDYEMELKLIIDLPVFGNIDIPLTNKGEVKLPKLSDVIFSKKR
ncbi:unnamed protein product [Linum trigynum]|uniref:Water stress and hypersensitive response domain-containing protein n=1 Tax=Linum trigynum TaxID=586398 RepID=A0AAV2DKL4_9ROSI